MATGGRVYGMSHQGTSNHRDATPGAVAGSPAKPSAMAYRSTACSGVPVPVSPTTRGPSSAGSITVRTTDHPSALAAATALLAIAASTVASPGADMHWSTHAYAVRFEKVVA